MSEYQLEIKQIVDYPRCRVYRKFIQSLIADRSIRTNNGCSGSFFILPYFALTPISAPHTGVSTASATLSIRANGSAGSKRYCPGCGCAQSGSLYLLWIPCKTAISHPV